MVNIIKFVTFCRITPDGSLLIIRQVDTGYQQGNFSLFFILFPIGDERIKSYYLKSIYRIQTTVEIRLRREIVVMRTRGR